MKKTFIYLFFIALIPSVANAQEAIVANAQSSNYAYTIGINTGLDHNINAYRLNPTIDGPVKGAVFNAGNNLFNIGNIKRILHPVKQVLYKYVVFVSVGL